MGRNPSSGSPHLCSTHTFAPDDDAETASLTLSSSSPLDSIPHPTSSAPKAPQTTHGLFIAILDYRGLSSVSSPLRSLSPFWTFDPELARIQTYFAFTSFLR